MLGNRNTHCLECDGAKFSPAERNGADHVLLVHVHKIMPLFKPVGDI